MRKLLSSLTIMAVALTPGSSRAATYESRWIEGVKVMTGAVGDLEAAVTIEKTRDLRLVVHLWNGSEDAITFDPAQIRAVVYSSGEIRPVEVYSPEEWRRKAQAKQTLDKVMFTLGEYGERRKDTSNRPRETYVRGRHATHGASGSTFGTFQATIIEPPTPEDQDAAQARADARVAEFKDQLARSSDEMLNGLAEIHTLSPQETYSGIVHLKKARGQHIRVFVPFGPHEFQFLWTFER